MQKYKYDYTRIPKKFIKINLLQGLDKSRLIFKAGSFNECFDLLNYLLENFQRNYLEILNQAYEFYKRMPYKDRYNLYQSRFFNFHLSEQDKILDIGSRDIPFPYATHLADISIKDSLYRSSGKPLRYIDKKPVYECNIEDMPFDDNEFEFVYCSHVLEHTQNPDKACSELSRIARRGFIECPAFHKDMYFNNGIVSNHLWKVDSIDNILVFEKYTPDELKGFACDVLKDMKINPQNNREKALYAIVYLKANLLNTMFYWEESFECSVFESKRDIYITEKSTESNNVIKDSSKKYSTSLSRSKLYPELEILLKNNDFENAYKIALFELMSNPNDVELEKIITSCEEKLIFRRDNKQLPRISFITLVLNGMPFIEYAIKAIYPFAHEIIIFEGPVEKALFASNVDGSSKDGTTEIINNFPDPEKKMIISRGIWEEKLEMLNKALEYVTGDYIWLVDSDEIWKGDDIDKIINILHSDPEITQMNFIPDNFWKGFEYIVFSQNFFEKQGHYRRLFKYNTGSKFISHEPLTLKYPDNGITEHIKLIDGNTTRNMGLFPYHYSYVYDMQVYQKVELYNRFGLGDNWGIILSDWYRDIFIKWTPENRHETEKKWGPWAGDKNSKTTKFKGSHPEIIKVLIEKLEIEKEKENDIGKPEINIESPKTLSGDLDFNIHLDKFISEYKPTKLIETGTYLGNGTTRIIANALKKHSGSDYKFYSIELNPSHVLNAIKNLYDSNLFRYVTILNGLSIPSKLLPKKSEIEEMCNNIIEFDNIFIEYEKHNRVDLYYSETNFDYLPDDLLDDCLSEFDYKPEFVLLDSAGHIGNIEFNYIVGKLKGTCIIALIDIYHIKHYKSYQQINNDPRFEILVTSKKNFGFCIAKFRPEIK